MQRMIKVAITLRRDEPSFFRMVLIVTADDVCSRDT